jgi:hypothetical protein
VSKREIYRSDLVNGTRALVYELDRIPGWGLDVSPDGRTLLMPVYDFDDADIYLSQGLP